MKLSTIKQNAIMNVIYTFTNMAFPLITYPYVTRVLLATGMGKVTFFSAISNYAVIIASLGLSTYGVRMVARVRDNKEKLSEIATELFLLNTIVTGIVVVFIVLSIPFIEQFGEEPTLLLVNLLIIVTAPLGLTWLFSGLEQYSYIAKRNLFFKVISLALVFLFVKKENDYPIYAMIIAFALISTFLCNFIYSQKFIRFKLSKNLKFKHHIRPMLYLFASLLAVSIYTCLDTIMLGFLSGNDSVGYYSVASKIKWLLLSTVNAISIVLLPRLSNYLINKEEKKYNSTLKKSFSFIFFVTVPLSTYFCIQASDCIYLLGGESFEKSISCMQILMPILIISGFSNVTGNQILIPSGRDSCFMKAVSIGAVVDIVLNYIFMPSLKEDGAALATLLAELTQMSVQCYYCRKEIMNNIVFRNIIKIVTGSILASSTTIYLESYIEVNVLENIVITFSCYFSSYFLALLILNKKISFYKIGNKNK